MKRTFKHNLLGLALVLLATSFAACGTDDDDGGGQNGNNAADNNSTDNNSTNNNTNNSTANNTANNSTNNNSNNANPNNSDVGVDPDQIPPVVGNELGMWLEEGSYVDWPAESAIHLSTGPHFGDVRTWVNDALFASLEAGNTSHPVGSASIKELYGENGTDALGFSVMVKVEEARGGGSWYWNETYNGRTLGEGVGIRTCAKARCHDNNVFLSPFPLQ